MLNVVVGIGMWIGIGIGIGIGSLFLTYGATMIKYLILAGTMALTACGGGGGGAAPTTTAPAAASTVEGLWAIFTTGGSAVFFVLETGETWGVTLPAGAVNLNVVSAGFSGTTTVSGTSTTTNGTSFDFVTNAVTAETLTGTLAPKSKWTLGKTDLTFGATYDTPSTLVAAAGAFTGTVGTGKAPSAGTSSGASTLTVTSAGTWSAGGGTCVVTGTMTPRASGKNVFNLTAIFTGTGCSMAEATGMASYSPSTKSLFAMGMNSAKSNGFFFAGVKP